MFEKEAEKYAHEHCCDSCKNLQARYRKIYQDGAEFGYNKAKGELEEKYKETICNLEMNLNSLTERLEELNKANEWHFVSKEGFPNKDDIYLVIRLRQREQ